MSNEEAILRNTLNQLMAQKQSAVSKEYNDAVSSKDEELQLYIKDENEKYELALVALRDAKDGSIAEKRELIEKEKLELKSVVEAKVNEKYAQIEASLQSALAIVASDIE